MKTYKQNWGLDEVVMPDDMNKIGKDFEDLNKEVLQKTSIQVCNEIPAQTKENTFYFKITKQQSSTGSENIKVSPNMGLKLI